jgi:hypothetical protein
MNSDFERILKMVIYRFLILVPIKSFRVFSPRGGTELSEKNFVKVLTPLKGVLKRGPAYRSSPVLDTL